MGEETEKVYIRDQSIVPGDRTEAANFNLQMTVRVPTCSSRPQNIADNRR